MEPLIDGKPAEASGLPAGGGRCLYCQRQGQHKCGDPSCIVVLMQSLRHNGIDVIARHIMAAVTKTQELGLPAPVVNITGSLVTGPATIFQDGISMIDNSRGKLGNNNTGNVIQEGGHNTATTGQNSAATGAGSSNTQQATAQSGTASTGNGPHSHAEGVTAQDFAEILHTVVDHHEELQARVASFEEKENAKDANQRVLSSQIADLWRFVAQTANRDSNSVEAKLKGLPSKTLLLMKEILLAAVAGTAEGAVSTLTGS